MNKPLQIRSFKNLFRSNNPNIGTDVMDWSAEVDKTLTFNENRENLIKNFPMFDWS